MLLLLQHTTRTAGLIATDRQRVADTKLHAAAAMIDRQTDRQTHTHTQRERERERESV